MRSLRARTCGPYLSLHSAHSYHDKTSSALRSSRWRSTVADGSQDNAAKEPTLPPLDHMYGPPLYSPTTSHPIGSPATVSGISCPQLTQRQMRQRQRKTGAMWRCRFESVSPRTLPAPRPTVLALPAASPRISVSAPHPETCAGALGRKAQADRVKRVPASNLSLLRRRNYTTAGTEGEVSSDGRPSTQAGSVGAATDYSVIHTAARGSAVGPSSEKDPLLAFLDTHEEDAALLLAMWTSLHRSCVYGSALSESLVLQVRYFLHSLLRYRAIGAAVHFYYRLMGIGVQLRQSDLLLLFSSLTYDNAAPTAEAQLRNAEETAAMAKDRKIWSQRCQQACVCAERARTAEAPRGSLHKSVEDRRDHVVGCQASMVKRTGAPALCKGGPTGANASFTVATRDTASSAEGSGTTHIAEGSRVDVSSSSRWDRGAAVDEVHPPSSIAHRVAFHQQPEWIKRWILYEASMGTLEDLEGAEDDGQLWGPSTCSIEDAARSGSRVQGGAAAPLVQRMEVAAVMEHLHLLALGAMQRDYISATGPRKPPRLSRQPQRRSSSLSRSSHVERGYWKEALQVVRSVCAPARWQADLSECDETASPEAADKFLLPDDVVYAMLSMLREVQSWEGALALLKLAIPTAEHGGAGPGGALCITPDSFRRGAVLFMALASSARPWRTQAKVEEWMHSALLPRLARRTREQAETTYSETSATAAFQALWLSHLCSIKAARPDEFVALGEEAMTYVTSPFTQEAIHGNLTLMMDEVRLSTGLALDALRRAVQEAIHHHRASESLAKSIRTGAYRVVGGKGAHDLRRDPENSDTSDPLPRPSVSAPATAMRGMLSPHASVHSAGTIFSPPAPRCWGDVVDAFALCCAAVTETVWLRLTVAASTDGTAATVEVLQFLERSVHSPAGLIDVYQLLYGLSVPPSAHHCKGSPLAPEANAMPPSEHAHMASLLAITLLRLVQLLCAPPGQQHHRFSAHLWNTAELVLLTEFTAKVLEQVTAQQVQQPPWRWAAEERLKELVSVTAATVRCVVRQLNIDCMNERAVFGAIADEHVELLALLARALSKSSELMVALRPTDAPRAFLQSPVWRILTRTCSPRLLQGVLLCFRSSSALGRRVRHQLGRRDAENLDRWIPLPRHRQSAFARGAAPPPLKLWRGAGGATGAAAVGYGGGRDFPLALRLRSSVYAIVKRERTSWGVGQALQQLAETAPDWKASVLLCHIVTKDIALARGTCPVHFFATTLDRMAQDVRRCAAASALAATSLLQGSRMRPSPGTSSALFTGHTCVPFNLWLRAIDVFWSAVDHTGQVEAAAAHHPDTSAVVASVTTLPSTPVSSAAQERAVLARLLLPLLRFSRAADQREVGRRWRRAWAAMYAPQEKQSPKWRQQNIEALSVLGDAAALTRCVADYRDCGSEALLCSVALRHGDWHSALGAVFKICGSLEERRATGTAFSAAVALTILTLLAKSPMNLSNTAMRLRTIQCETWDAECSLAVVRLLLRGRRWRLALTHVDEALDLPDMQRVRATVLLGPPSGSRKEAPSTSPTEAMLAHYAQLLTAALQAAAIGGDSERAPVYYNAFKALLRYVFGDVVDMDAFHAAEDSQHRNDDDGLDAALSMTNVSGRGEGQASHMEGSLQRTVQDLAPRARMLFFRAMTKKMLTPHPARS
ncbi:hypothetical protein LSCM1_00106 [Leishmania martiniquensis]|uniref:Uncharacterized protein n=1 Tax=Leishmania martiniquensis TaxID=1580590 RepID=A0A836GTM9_9TRYP|nr:hypothetical protein LSCM1_00106 [Leishmania martiniquensis]